MKGYTVFNVEQIDGLPEQYYGKPEVQKTPVERIADAEEVEWLGLRDFAEPQLWLIEWPERARGAIPKPDLVVFLSHAGTVRDARLEALTPRGSVWLDSLRSAA